METTSELTLKFDGISQSDLINGLARHHNYSAQIRQKTEGGFQLIDNPVSKEEFIATIYTKRLMEHWKSGTIELAADVARIQATALIEKLKT